ncbi:MAG: response regulator transcription factor [Verrucomicrobia bacterium]|nr:response regulator transcription factor [Verrucomicrobiota bacterium]
MRILLVEDSPRLRKMLTAALKSSGYAVDTAETGDEGLWMAQTHPYDALILDIMLPGLDGLNLLGRLRQSGRDTPALFLTAKDAVQDRVTGLRKGADDYLTKPFALEELLARVEALCRRKYPQAKSILRAGDLELDPGSKAVSRGGVPIQLAAREFALLEHLLLRKGRVVSRTEIEEHIYDQLASPMSNVVDSAICALRRLLAVRPDAPPVIQTRRGLGYIIEDPKG